MRISDWSADVFSSDLRTISIVLLGVCALLSVIAIALINNTIRLAIYSQRFIIKSMQLVGATKNFIKRPFLWLGILHGLLGALAAIVLLTGLVYFAERQLPELNAVLNYGRSEERRVGKECVSTCRSLWSLYHKKKKKK